MEKEIYGLFLAQVLGPACPVAAEALRLCQGGQCQPDLSQLSQAGLLSPARLRAAQRWDAALAREELERVRAAGAALLFPFDEQYPEALRHIPSPPLALYVKGDVAALSPPLPVAVVGSRQPSEYGRAAAAEIAGGLAKGGALVVSGLARGLDTVAHTAALEVGAPTVAFIACGVDRCYPAENRDLAQKIAGCGAVVSEYPMGARPQKVSFLQRNRLIAGFSRGVCVAEAAARSGALATAHRAAEAGREVFAVPGSIFSAACAGNLSLLAEGAAPALSASFILSCFGVESAPSPLPEEETPVFSPAATAVLAGLEKDPLPLEEICRRTGLSPAKALSALSELEMEGAAAKRPGMRYAKAL